MPTKEQYADHSWMLEQLKNAQDADHDNRDRAREAHKFVDKRDGQWERKWYDANDGKPRYTFDLTNPIIDQVAGDMERSDFDIRITPAGGDSTKEAAKTLDGMVRNIENISGATSIYNRAGREMITCGFDAIRVVQKYVDDNSFDQDLVIEKIGNALDRVWFGPHEEPDASDAQFGWVLTGITPAEFENLYPDRGKSSVSSDRASNTYFHRQDLVMVGEFLYLKPVERELVLMSDGSVLEVDEEFDSVADELLAAGITEVRRRKRTKHEVCSRLFDTDGWIGKSRKTVFENWIPVVPLYGNFKVFEDKITYWGVVEKLIDAQRVFNYAKSREVEEGALAPRAKYWMTPAQAQGWEETLATMNTNSDPVQLFNADPENPGIPQQNGGAVINPGLLSISQSMQQILQMSAGFYDANMGNNPGLQSGKAIEALQDRGDLGNNKYISAREIAQRHTGKILINAIPRVYEPGRQVRVLKEDGAYEMVPIGQQVIDNQTGKLITLNDLGVGSYDVVCESGPSFKNRQNESARALMEMGSVDPSIMEMNSDILLNNIPAPGMDQAARRKRRQLFQAGAIPEEDMTDEEKALQQQMAQQPPQESPEMVLARAEEAKGQAEIANAQTKQAQVQGEIQIKMGDLQVKQQQLKIDAFEAETDRYKAQIAEAEAKANIQGKGASAAKALSEAQAQDIENDMALSGITDLVGAVSGGR